MTNGSCLCGKISFTVKSKFDNMSHCHCSMCRKIHGTAFATYVNATELQWNSGEDLIVRYESSKGFYRAFCSCCGSVVPEISSDKPGVWSLPAGMLDSDPGIRPECHIFAESIAPWYSITDALDQVMQYGADDQRSVIEKPELVGKAGDGYTGGSCECGQCSFRFSGDPELMMYCHCSRCRKVKGAAHAANVFVKPENFEWITGEHKTTNYDLPGAKRFGNSFCTSCGSSMPRIAKESPMYNIPAGSLDDPLNIQPKGHIFVGSKAPWYEITGDLPRYDEMPT